MKKKRLARCHFNLCNSPSPVHDMKWYLRHEHFMLWNKVQLWAKKVPLIQLLIAAKHLSQCKL